MVASTARKTLTVAEAAERIGVCVPVMYRYLRSGEVPSVRVGYARNARYVIATQAFDRWMNGKD